MTASRDSVDATVPRRKTQALARIGHDCADVAAAAGIPATTIEAIRRGDIARTRPGNAAAIDHAWRALHMTLGTSQHARRTAETNGWAPPLAYDNIDDPSERPRWIRPANATWHPEDVHELRRLGESDEAIAARLGVGVKSLQDRMRTWERKGAAA